MKKILLLGGSDQQVIAIETAKRLGLYTILCDYLPDNPGQYVADKFYLVSTTDINKIMEVANEEKIDGVLAYASDPAAPTAAYVSEKLGLPTNPFIAVETLCNKELFRNFLRENDFNPPIAKGYSSMDLLYSDKQMYTMPLIVKPVDSSGSKGISVVYDWNEIEKAVNYAINFSRKRRFIVEEYIEKKHRYLVGGDIFVLDGKIVIWGLLNCHRDVNVNPLVPAGKSFPLYLDDDDIKHIKETLQALIQKLGIKFGALNVELIVDKQNNVRLLDVGPRSGGNMIPELLSMIFGLNIVEMTIKVAMGEKKIPCSTNQEKQDYYATYNLHTAQNGRFQGIRISAELSPYIIRQCIYKSKGDNVEYFDNAAKAIGIIFMHFNTEDKMYFYLNNIDKYISIDVSND